jgi:hypothetical protein
MSNEGQESISDWRRLPSPAAALRAAFAAATRSDEASTSTASQRDGSGATALFCLPMLDWPSNLFA